MLVWTFLFYGIHWYVALQQCNSATSKVNCGLEWVGLWAGLLNGWIKPVIGCLELGDDIQNPCPMDFA